MTPAEIWREDLFGRQVESEQLIGFLETVATRSSLREDGHSYVLALDAPYGEGKSFFLRRFAQHMALSHPVAFVDAWTDDLEDEPLVALAATLTQAFSRFEDQSGELKRRVANVIEKTGKVAKIAAGGLVKRGLGLLLTPAATEAAAMVIGEVAESSSDAIREDTDKILDDVSSEITKVVTPSMQGRIDRFNEGRAAVLAMKQSLRDLVAYLGRDGIYPPPIVIVIDELDRCRPTYALKLLEEVKHLFDVEGVAFVLGMHGDALARSVSGAYGSSFNGEAYLGRFINRRYSLKEAPLYALLSMLFKERGMAPLRLQALRFAVEERNPNGDPIALLALLMKGYGLNARDAFAVVDSLEVCLALTGTDNLILPYIAPLIFNQIQGKSGMALLPAKQLWRYIEGASMRSDVIEWHPDVLANRYDAVAQMSVNQLMDAVNGDDPDLAIRSVAALTFDGQPDKLSSPRNYKYLLRSVDRFTSVKVTRDGDA